MGSFRRCQSKVSPAQCGFYGNDWLNRAPKQLVLDKCEQSSLAPRSHEDYTRLANASLEPHLYPVLDTYLPGMSPSTSESSFQSIEKVGQDTMGGESKRQRYVRYLLRLLDCKHT